MADEKSHFERWCDIIGKMPLRSPELQAARRERKAVEDMAADLAPELDRLLNKYLSGPTPAGKRALEHFLWDNKVGLLRLAQAHVSE